MVHLSKFYSLKYKGGGSRISFRRVFTTKEWRDRIGEINKYEEEGFISGKAAGGCASPFNLPLIPSLNVFEIYLDKTKAACERRCTSTNLNVTAVL